MLCVADRSAVQALADSSLTCFFSGLLFGLRMLTSGKERLLAFLHQNPSSHRLTLSDCCTGFRSSCQWKCEVHCIEKHWRRVPQACRHLAAAIHYPLSSATLANIGCILCRTLQQPAMKRARAPSPRSIWWHAHWGCCHLAAAACAAWGSTPGAARTPLQTRIVKTKW